MLHAVALGAEDVGGEVLHNRNNAAPAECEQRAASLGVRVDYYGRVPDSAQPISSGPRGSTIERALASDRYQFVSVSSTGFGGKAAIVARLRADKRAECWVNPADPNDAVIERGPTAELWYMLLPLLFVTIGVAGMYFTTIGRGSRLFQKRAGISRAS